MDKNESTDANTSDVGLKVAMLHCLEPGRSKLVELNAESATNNKGTTHARYAVYKKTFVVCFMSLPCTRIGMFYPNIGRSFDIYTAGF